MTEFASVRGETLDFGKKKRQFCLSKVDFVAAKQPPHFF